MRLFSLSALFFLLAAAFAALRCAAMEAGGQEPNNYSQEFLQIIVTAREITVGANFAGTDFYIAGALENGDPLLRRQNRYDIITVLEGPSQNVRLYQKLRRFGIWVNDAPVKFSNVPQFYALASTRELRDITTPQTYRSLNLSADYLPIRLHHISDPKRAEFYKSRLIALREEQGLYRQETGAVAFGSPSLFSARFHLPDNVPVGTYTVRAFLFRDGVYTDEAAAALEISRKNIAYSLYRAAQNYSLLYGLSAVLIAVFIGFIGRLIFPK